MFVDLSLTVPLAAHGGTQAILEAMELGPLSKILRSTDAFSIPEIFYLAALGCRRSLAAALERLCGGHWLTAPEMEQVARMLLHENA